MKKIIWLISFLALIINSNGQKRTTRDSYTISGHLSGWNNQYIYFTCHGIAKSRTWDSTLVKNNTFQFKGKLKEPSNGFITTLKFDRLQNLKDRNVTQRLFISPSDMAIHLVSNNFQSAKLIGSEYQDEYDHLEKSKENLYKKLDSLSNLYDNLNNKYTAAIKTGSASFTLKILESPLDSINEMSEILKTKWTHIDKGFFNQHPDSYITGYLLSDYYNHFNLSELRHYYNAMQTKNKRWEFGIKLKEVITKLAKGSPGAMAPNFSAIDFNGDTLSLLKYRGSYILLDFWASWCKPCRAGNPELINLYKKYKSEGIEFIGLADDKGSEDKWKSAILKDNINTWKQIIDDKIGDNYSVYSIPLQILIDKDGKIIGRFGEGGEPNENLVKKMEEVFGR